MPAPANKRLKHEPMVGDPDLDNLKYMEADPYEAASEEVLRQKWIEESKKLYGDFLPAPTARSLVVINKKNVADIVASIKKMMLADWQDIHFVIGSNPDDNIEIKFDGRSIETTKGLKAYMNNLLTQKLEGIGLRRVVHFWGYMEKNYIYYMLSPPWVHLPVNDVVNQLPIKESGSGDEQTTSESEESSEGGFE